MLWLLLLPVLLLVAIGGGLVISKFLFPRTDRGPDRRGNRRRRSADGLAKAFEVAADRARTRPAKRFGARRARGGSAGRFLSRKGGFGVLRKGLAFGENGKILPVSADRCSPPLPVCRVPHVERQRRRTRRNTWRAAAHRHPERQQRDGAGRRHERPVEHRCSQRGLLVRLGRTADAEHRGGDRRRLLRRDGRPDAERTDDAGSRPRDAQSGCGHRLSRARSAGKAAGDSVTPAVFPLRSSVAGRAPPARAG